MFNRTYIIRTRSSTSSFVHKAGTSSADAKRLAKNLIKVGGWKAATVYAVTPSGKEFFVAAYVE